MGSKSSPSSFDCYARAEPDEPMFVLLGRDPTTSLMIELWVAIRQQMGSAEPDQIEEAHSCSEACHDWVARKGKIDQLRRVGPAFDQIIGLPPHHDRLNFDLAIGRLDHVLSQLIGFAKDKNRDDADRQTLKHHAEDMIAAGQKILSELAPTYSCVHCGAASPKDEWGPGRVTCPKCGKVAPTASESAA